MRVGLGSLILLIGTVCGSTAVAKTIGECGDVQVSKATRCSVKLTLGCAEGCGPRRMLKACATQGVPACREVCHEQPGMICTGDCGGTCEDRCKVDDLVCQKGCATECLATCADHCDDAADPGHCRAVCEANCGSECDVQCAELPADARCLEHCFQCCSGSCTAQANIVCQTECQEGGLVGCQDGLAEACHAGCDADGALFCDGQFIMAGVEMSACIVALKSHSVPVELDTDVSLGGVVDAANELGLSSKGCTTQPGADSHGLWMLLALGLVGLRRRARAAR